MSWAATRVNSRKPKQCKLCSKEKAQAISSQPLFFIPDGFLPAINEVPSWAFQPLGRSQTIRARGEGAGRRRLSPRLERQSLPDLLPQQFPYSHKGVEFRQDPPHLVPPHPAPPHQQIKSQLCEVPPAVIRGLRARATSASERAPTETQEFPQLHR